MDFSEIPKAHRNRVEAILFNKALEEKDAKRKLQLLSLFERQFPASTHLGKVRYLFFLTHVERKTNLKLLRPQKLYSSATNRVRMCSFTPLSTISRRT